MTTDLPAPADWDRMPWPARQRWATAHGYRSVRAVQIAMTAAVPRRPRWRPAWPLTIVRAGQWSDEQHYRSVHADLDPAVVAARRAAVTNQPINHPDIQTGLP